LWEFGAFFEFVAEKFKNGSTKFQTEEIKSPSIVVDIHNIVYCENIPPITDIRREASHNHKLKSIVTASHLLQILEGKLHTTTS